MSGWSIACSPRPGMASAGAATGSTSRGTPTATATKATATARSAYRYRDFVIRALNADMPFDQFVRWQLAGDEYAPDNASAVAATGFCTAAPSQETTPADTEENKAKIRYDELDNMLATTGSALLGLSVGCARCHDHKFDPIPTRDYYRMLAAFQTSERRVAPLSRPHRDLDRWLREQRRLYREAKMTELGLTDEREVLAAPARALLRPGSDRALQEVRQAARSDDRTAPRLDERGRAGNA